MKMKKRVKRVKFRNYYDVELKRRLAKSYLAGEASYGVLAQENGLKNKGVVKQFVKWYRRILVEEQIDVDKLKERKENKSAKDLSELTKEELLTLLKIEESKKVDAQMRAEFFETMIDIAEKRFSISIKKKPGTKQ